MFKTSTPETAQKTTYVVASIVMGNRYAEEEFSTLEEAKAYILANPPDADRALEILNEYAWDELEMQYVVEDRDTKGRSKTQAVVEDGDDLDEAFGEQ